MQDYTKECPNGQHAPTVDGQTFSFSRFKSKNDNAPKVARLDWRQLCELLSKRRKTRSASDADKDGPLLSGASYPDGATRGNAGVSFVSLAILDFDGGATLEQIKAGVSRLNNGDGAAAFIYSTFSHDPDAGAFKYRLVLPLLEPVAGADWPQAWKRFFLAFDGAPDEKAKDAARIHFLPSCPKAREHFAVALELDGAPLDVSTLPELPVEPRETPVFAPQNAGGDLYARAAFEKEIGRLCATTGNRNDALNQIARRLGQFIGAGRLDRSEVEHALMNAASANGYTSKDGAAEARATMKSGLDAGEREPNFSKMPSERNGAASTLGARAIATQKSSEPGEQPPAPMFEVWSYKQLRALPRLSWLIDQILPVGGTSWLTATAGHLKSFWGIDAACCIATGRRFHGRAVKRGNVVYVAAEGATGLPDRLDAWAAKHQTEVPDVPALGIIKKPADVAAPEVWAGFAASVRALKPVFIVLDTQSRCSVGRDLNTTSEATIFYDAVSRLAEELGAQILIIAHNNRTGQYAGNHQGPAMVDTHLTLKREGSRLQFRCSKQKDGAAEEAAAMDFETRVFELDGRDEQGRAITSLALEAVEISDEPKPEAPDKNAMVRGEMLDVLRQDFPKGAGAKAWQERCAELKVCQKTAFYDRRDELKTNGQIQQSRGVWLPTNATGSPSSSGSLGSQANSTNLPDSLGSSGSRISSPVGTTNREPANLTGEPEARTQNETTGGDDEEAAGVDF